MRKGGEASFVHSCMRAFFAFLAFLTLPPSVLAQTPPEPVERLAFREAIDRAIANNPSTAIAAAGILRAEGLLSQARSATLLQITGNVTTTTLNRGVSFEDTTVTPRNQVAGSLTVDMPVIAAAAWARRAQAGDNRDVAVLSATEARRQIALATADAYLAISSSRAMCARATMPARTSISRLSSSSRGPAAA
jgi:outer membrane protein TolC